MISSLPTCQLGSRLTLSRLALGVKGYAILKGGAYYIPIIEAEQEGSGDVGRFLDALDPAVTFKIPCVINARLAMMLVRRGFRRVVEHTDEGDPVEVWQRGILTR